MSAGWTDLNVQIRQAVPKRNRVNAALATDLLQDTHGIRTTKYLCRRLETYSAVLDSLRHSPSPIHMTIYGRLTNCSSHRRCRQHWCPICVLKHIRRTEQRFANLTSSNPNLKLSFVTMVIGALENTDEVEDAVRNFKNRFAQFAKDWRKATESPLNYAGQIEVDLECAKFIVGRKDSATYQCLKSISGDCISRRAEEGGLILKPHAHMWIASSDAAALKSKIHSYGMGNANLCNSIRHWPAPYQVNFRSEEGSKTTVENLADTASYIHKNTIGVPDNARRDRENIIRFKVTMTHELDDIVRSTFFGAASRQ